jgi:NAD(P)H-hydrate epimerase
MEEKFQLNLPEYPGYDQIVELPPVSPPDSPQKL